LIPTAAIIIWQRLQEHAQISRKIQNTLTKANDQQAINKPTNTVYYTDS
jgi:hypothetical protein